MDSLGLKEEETVDTEHAEKYAHIVDMDAQPGHTVVALCGKRFKLRVRNPEAEICLQCARLAMELGVQVVNA